MTEAEAGPEPVNERGEGLIDALEESTAHEDLVAYVRKAREAGGTGVLSSMRTFHDGGDGDISRWREVGTRKETILWDHGAAVALQEVGNWDVTNRPILQEIVDERVADGDGDV